jgi:predicted metalloprotease with PDZ domain
MGGLIGNDLLRRFNTILDYDRRTFHLTPNSHYLDPFDYTYTGLELYFENGEIFLGDVAKDSPAEKAGLKEGDIVMAINNNFSHNLTQLKTTLQSATDKIKIIIKRGDELKEFTFKVKSIL